jgi:hypothetical protein
LDLTHLGIDLLVKHFILNLNSHLAWLWREKQQLHNGEYSKENHQDHK